MLDMKKTGAYISNLRKEKDLTQVELADLLNVSHQAVSKWERGESVPDVGTLPGLAEILEVSIDSILKGSRVTHLESNTFKSEGAVVEEAAKNNPEKITEMILNHELDIDSVINVAPILKSSTLNRITKGLKDFIDFRQIAELAPFLGRDTLTWLISVAEGRCRALDVVVMAPFLSSDILGELIERLPTEDGVNNFEFLVSIAPFASRSKLDSLIGPLVDKPIDRSQILSLAPFIGKTYVEALVDRLPEGGISYEFLGCIAPFVSREFLRKTVEKLGDASCSSRHITPLAPFLDKSTLGNLVEKMDSDDFDLEFLRSIAPFLDKSTCDALVVTIVKRLKA